MKASVIISVYKNVNALRFVLDSLRCQTEKDFEIIISEDGNSDIMFDFVRNYDWFCQYQHITQDDLGWRKNRALNRAIVKAKADWLIFLDGDCIVHRCFVEMHLFYAKPNHVLVGKRVKLSEKLTLKLFDGDIKFRALGREMWKRLLFRQGCRFTDEGIFISLCSSKPLRGAKMLKGCNMSFSKETILAINGFNEDYKLPSIGEDEDIDWRLRAIGCQFVSVRNRAIVYHLHHKSNWDSNDRNKNLVIMEREKISNRFICHNGINNHI